MKKRESISHIMTKNVLTVGLHQSLEDVDQLMKKHAIRHVPVTSGDEIIGMISHTDMMRISYGVSQNDVENQQGMFSSLKIQDVMTRQIVSLSIEATVRDAGEVLAEKEFSALPVLEQGKLAGIVTTTDLIRYLLEQY